MDRKAPVGVTNKIKRLFDFIGLDSPISSIENGGFAWTAVNEIFDKI
jgi:hypothetical protein